MFAELRVFEDEPARLVGLLRKDDGEPAQQADVASISYRVFRYSSRLNAVREVDGTEVGAEETLVVSDVLFDELQTNPLIGCGTEAYNFDASIARFEEVGWYRVEVEFPGLFAVWIIEVLPVASA
jgi:hypothetical protein